MVGVVAAAAPAHAEDRKASFDVGAWFGALPTNEFGLDEDIGGVAVVVGWEPSTVELPADKGYAYKGVWSPELVGGILEIGAQGETFVGVGLRAGVAIGQRKMGLLELTGRSTIYLAGRAAVIGDDQSPLYSFVIGASLSPGESAFRFGFEVGAIGLERPGFDGSGAVASIYLGLHR